jgi:hypothetical protein
MIRSIIFSAEKKNEKQCTTALLPFCGKDSILGFCRCLAEFSYHGIQNRKQRNLNQQKKERKQRARTQ